MESKSMPEAMSLNALTGDLSVALLEHALAVVKRYPESVDAYALFSSLRELRGFFEDEQGIPMSEALDIDRALLQGVRELIASGFLDRTEVPPSDIVRGLVSGLAV